MTDAAGTEASPLDDLPRPTTNGTLDVVTDVEDAFVLEEMLPGAVAGVWPHIAGMIRDAVNASDVYSKLETPQDIMMRCEAGDYNLWLVFKGAEIKAALVVSLDCYPRMNIFTINYCGGCDIDDWIDDLHTYVVERGRNANCRFIRIDGRYGWIGKLQKLGFNETSRQFTKEI